VAREQRRLAAILAADMVGYSRLMGRDESGTLARLRKNRSEHLNPVLTKYGGRLVKLTGDGALVEFASAVDALSAAMEFQQAMAEANSDRPTDSALVFRMGLHLGDLIVDGDDLYGDGVNIAARLEAEAPAGGIVISRTVHEAVTGRVKATFEDLGSLTLKNIERPIQAFSVKWEPSDWQLLATPEVTVAPAAALQVPLPLPDKPSIAVLPFQNMSGDPEQEYFADGIVEDIITALSRFKSLFVIARNSSFTYKGRPVDIKQVGRELGVRYVLEGSVRKSGGRVRITGQLIEAATGEHLWAERYDRDLSDVFTLQDEITVRIASAVDPAIRDAQTKAALRKHPTDLGAWDRVLRGLWHLNQFKQAANEEGRRELLAAIERDSGSAPAHAWLGITHVFDAWFNWTQAHAASLEQAHQAATLAVKLDPQEPLAHVAVTLACFWLGRMEQAKNAAELAISLNPNSFLANFTGAAARNYLGECEAAVPYHLKALDLSPNDPLAWNCLGSLAHTYFNLGDFNEAVNCANRAIVLRHGYLFGRVVKTAALAHQGRRDEAAASLRAIFEISRDFSLKKLEHYPFVLDSQRKHLFAGLGKAGLPVTLTTASLPAVELALPDKPSIAVLPFQNMSGDPEQEYFADGVVEEIITALSRMRWLFVIARNSTFTYKGRAVDVKQIGRELGVRYVLEGSVRKAANRVRITGQLIDTATGAHLWADRFDGGLEDIFDLQDQVTASVVGAIAPTLEKAEIDRAKRKPTESLDAYDYYLRGLASHYKITSRQANAEALSLFNRAIELDPDFASAYGRAASCYMDRRSNGWMTDLASESAEVARLAQRAVELGKDDAIALATSGWALVYVVRDVDAGAAFIDRALVLNPNLAVAWFYGGWVKTWLGEPDAGLERLARALRLSPLDPFMSGIQQGAAHAHMFAGRYDDASRWAAMSLRDAPDYQPGLRISAASNALAGRLEQAQKMVVRMQHLNPSLRVSTLREVVGPYRRAEDLARYEEGLRKAGLPE
jgi:TolB-like protein/class 3 adenylate cyclase/Tfp pilus assembly protein PilF